MAIIQMTLKIRCHFCTYKYNEIHRNDLDNHKCYHIVCPIQYIHYYLSIEIHPLNIQLQQILDTNVLPKNNNKWNNIYKI